MSKRGIFRAYHTEILDELLNMEGVVVPIAAHSIDQRTNLFQTRVSLGLNHVLIHRFC